ncbi:DNA methyltransferase [Neisseriaceae bacterium B1]
MANWYVKAAKIMRDNPRVQTASVSTNSITQGQQVEALWGELLAWGVEISFAHRTFQWTSQASSKVAVHCVIIGFRIGAGAARAQIAESSKAKMWERAAPAPILAA